MEFVEAKSIMSKVKQNPYFSWFGVDYNMNLYRGCNHGCIYCDSRSDCYNIQNFDTVRIKKDAITILEKECATKRTKGVVGIGAMSDTYNPFERQYEVTRDALKVLDKYGYGVNIETKSDLVVRDIDLLTSIANKHSALVKFSVSCVDDELAQKIEPHVVPTSKRLAAMKELSDAGIVTGVLLMPVIPFISDNIDNVRKIVELSAKNGAKFIYGAFGMTLREGQREYYYEEVDKLFPGLSDRYKRVYGYRYSCQANSAKILQKEFEKLCKEYGLKYKMGDIIKLYKKQEEKKPEQLAMF